MRTKKGFAPYEQPSPADGCYIHGWRWVPTDEDYTAFAFLIFHLSDNLLLPSTEIARINQKGLLIGEVGDDHSANLRDQHLWCEDDIDLANDIKLAGLVEALDEKSQGLATYRLWKSNDTVNREVIVVLELAKEEPQDNIAPEIIKPYQRCALSPTGLHVAEGRMAMINTGGKTPRKEDCCIHCLHILRTDAFPH